MAVTRSLFQYYRPCKSPKPFGALRTLGRGSSHSLPVWLPSKNADAVTHTFSGTLHATPNDVLWHREKRASAVDPR
jgi:hypothetical protein